jgi:subtilase family serine protease
VPRPKSSVHALGAGLLATYLLVASCGDSGPAEPTPPAENVVVTLDATVFSLKIGEVKSLTATVSGTANTQVRWESSAASVATVLGGVVTGRQGGTAIITARSVVDANKTATALVTVTASNTDLVIDQVSAPAAGSIGGTIAVSVTVRNQGEATDRAFRAGFYFSTDATITGADVFSGFFCDVPEGLGAGLTRSCNGTIAVPATLPPGPYYVGAIADDQARVDETNEGNNARAAAATTTIVASTAPDLVIDSVGAPATGSVGGTITAAAVVRNQGLATTTSFRVAFYYSPDPTITTADVFSGTTCAYPGGLGLNAADSCDGDVAVPNTLSAGTWYLGAIADDQARVTEQDEANNTRAAPATIAISGAAPDLVIEAVAGPSSATAGAAFSPSATVRNLGGAAAPAFRLGYYLSTDSAITTTDRLVGVCDRPGLAAGASIACGGSVPLPATVAAGTYYLGAIADDQARVSEANEGNNVRVAASPVVVTGNSADLAVTAFTAPATGTVGGPITVTVTVRNQGAAAATGYRVGFYFSTDPTITTQDVASTTTCTDTDLPAGGTFNCSGPIAVPPSLAPGAYWVGAIADDQQQVAESDEANNARAAAAATQIGPPMPDFVVEALTAPTTGQTGDSIEVTVRARNVGTSATAAVRSAFYYSTDATITTADVYSGMVCPHGVLAANQTHTCAGKVSVPGSLAPGSYYVGAIVDDVAAIQEADEGNNARAAAQPTMLTLGRLNLTIDGMYLTQATQTYQGTVPLVAERDAFLRVFVIGNRADPATPSVRVRFYLGGNLADTRTIAPGRTVAGAIDEGTLASSWNVLVPAALVQPGLAVLADVDPGQQVSELSESDNAFPRSGTPLPLDVRAVPRFDVTFVPILTTINNQTGNVTSANAAGFLTDALKMLPLVRSDVVVRSTFTTNAGSLTLASSWNQIIGELDALRVAEGSNRHYLGVMATVQGAAWCGFGYIPGRSAIAMDRCGAALYAHEWGHNLSLDHAPCGEVANPDRQYPYGNARLGTYGLDVTTQTLKVPEQNYDLMSYCGPQWISDYHYRKALTYRGTAAGAPSTGAAGPALLVWGRVEGGRVVLEPAFELVARPTLPDAPGPYRVEGLTPDGRLLFSLPFAGRALAHGSGADRHFAFAVPITWRDGEVATLRVSGPRGQAVARAAPAAVSGAAGPAPAAASRAAPDRAVVRWDAAAYPMAMVRDAATGEVLSFARGGSVVLHTPAAELELVLSDGVRSTASRIRVAP